MNIRTEGINFENPSDNFMQVVPQTSRTIATVRNNQLMAEPLMNTALSTYVKFGFTARQGETQQGETSRQRGHDVKAFPRVSDEYSHFSTAVRNAKATSPPLDVSGERAA